MQKSIKEIFREMFPVLLLASALPQILTFFINLAGFGYQALVKQLNPMLFMGGDTDPASIVSSILPDSGGILAGVLVFALVYWIFFLLFEAGANLAIYRKIRYGTDIGLEDLFFFFNRHIVFSFFALLIVGLLSGLGVIFLLIPSIFTKNFAAIVLAALISFVLAIIISSGFFAFPATLAEGREGTKRGLIWLIKHSWQTTRGYKGMIFGKNLLYGIIASVVSAAVTIPISFATANQVMENPDSALALVIIPLVNSIMAIISGLIVYLAAIDIYKELVEKGAFGQEEEELTEEDYLAMEDVAPSPLRAKEESSEDSEEPKA